MPTSHATAPPTTAAAFKDDLLHFINEVLPKTRGKPREPMEVDGSTSLFESGLIDSLAIVQLIAFVERATGQGILPRMVVMKHFRSVDAICETFGPRKELTQWGPAPAECGAFPDLVNGWERSERGP